MERIRVKYRNKGKWSIKMERRRVEYRDKEK